MSASKRYSENVTNPSGFFGEIASGNLKQILNTYRHKFNPVLITAILTRKPENIKDTLASTQYSNNASSSPLPCLPHHTFTELRNNRHFAGALNKPVILAMKLCNMESTETTRDNGVTRYDVLHLLGKYFGDLERDAEQKGYQRPNLSEVLEFGKGLENQLPLDTFINGLSDENKARAAEILNPNDSNPARCD